MTKKDYVLIAQVERQSFDMPYSENEIAHMNRLADALEKENPRFDRKKFLLACGLE